MESIPITSDILKLVWYEDKNVNLFISLSFEVSLDFCTETLPKSFSFLFAALSPAKSWIGENDKIFNYRKLCWSQSNSITVDFRNRIF